MAREINKRLFGDSLNTKRTILTLIKDILRRWRSRLTLSLAVNVVIIPRTALLFY
jgi:hypothetical protein